MVSKTTLKTYFENGKVPNESHYIDLIDSLAGNPIETALDLTNITEPSSPASGYNRLFSISDAVFSKRSDGSKTLLSFFGCYGSSGAITNLFSNGVWASIPHAGSEYWDQGGCHDPSSNSDKFYAPYDGFYLMTTSIFFASNATGVRAVRIYTGTSLTIGYSLIGAANGMFTVVNVAGIAKLTSGQYLMAQGYQTSGGNLNLDAAYTQFARIG